MLTKKAKNLLSSPDRQHLALLTLIADCLSSLIGPKVESISGPLNLRKRLILFNLTAASDGALLKLLQVLNTLRIEAKGSPLIGIWALIL